MITSLSPALRRLLLWLLALIVLGVLFVSALPELMRYGAVALLERQGEKQVSIADINFNPFTGEFEIERLATDSGLLLRHAKLRLDWWPLWQQRLSITELRGDTLELTVAQRPDGSLDIGGIKIPATKKQESPSAEAGSKGEPWQITLPSVDFSHIALTLRLPAHKQVAARTIRLALGDLYLYKLAASDKGLQLAELRLDGFASDDSAAQLPKSVRRLQLFDLQASAASGVRLASGKILAVELAPPAPLQSGSIGGAALKQLRATTKGAFSIADLRIDGITLPRYKTTRLGSCASLQLNGIKGEAAGRLAAERIVLQRLTLPADGTTAPDSIGAVQVSGLDADTAHIDMQTLTLDRLQMALLRRPDGSIALPPLPTEPATSAEAATPLPAAENRAAATPFVLRIGRFSLTGDSSVRLRDESVKPVFKSTVAVRRLELAPLTIGRAEAGQLTLALALGETTAFNARGSLTADPAHLAMNLHVSLKELSLPQLSPFIEHALHVAIKTGQLDLDSQAQIANRALTSSNAIHIRRLQIETGEGAPLAGGMPINTALDMIRDDAGDIDLKVPLNGPLNDLKAGLGDVINQALMKAMQKAALAYASQYLYPYGTIISLTTKVAKAAMAQPRLTPITFPPLQDQLDARGTDYAGKIAGLLRDKKRIRLQVCGIAAPAEAQAGNANRAAPDDEKLLDLADARARRVIDTIAAKGVATDRLFDCKPDIDRANAAQGRVELLLQ